MSCLRTSRAADIVRGAQSNSTVKPPLTRRDADAHFPPRIDRRSAMRRGGRFLRFSASGQCSGAPKLPFRPAVVLISQHMRACRYFGSAQPPRSLGRNRTQTGNLMIQYRFRRRGSHGIAAKACASSRARRTSVPDWRSSRGGPWFGRISRISCMLQTDFGHSGPLCVHVVFLLALSNRTSSKTRVVARIAAIAFARSQDVLTD